MVERLGPGVQTGRDVAKPLAPCQLSKGHADELLTTAEMLDATLSVIALDQPRQCLAIHKIENLRKDVAARIHGPKSCPGSLRNSNA